MMGTTVLYSTGDSGVAGNGGCITPNGTAESTDPDAIMFNVCFLFCYYVISIVNSADIVWFTCSLTSL